MRYSLEDGIYRRPLALRLLYGAINTLAITGWLFLLVIIITMLTNTFDDLILILWEI